eukprot:TRINITY_DN1457_c0_g2_i1.p1 TRINITY_DN1457_c0_g2~~TRINITY_DN1457_c0_g2_i1.p1  ORF type:complete len:375 (-),score=101.38 TRINITY_DN1457_c0_g2_i1:120-1151(-)
MSSSPKRKRDGDFEEQAIEPKDPKIEGENTSNNNNTEAKTSQSQEEDQVKVNWEDDEEDETQRDASETNTNTVNNESSNSKDNANTNNEEEEGEDEEEDNFREPIVDGRNITFQTRILNQYLVCSICMGYFRDPHTIKECLHTFCKVCIFRYLSENSDCPICGISLSPFPFEYVRFDRTLCSLINNIFPQLLEQDLEDERRFCEEKGLPLPAHVKEWIDRRGGPAPKPMVVRKLTAEEAAKSFYNDEIAFELHLDESAKKAGSPLIELAKPHIRTTAKITIVYIKKYLAQKVGVSQADQIEVLYKGEVLGVEHSLEYVLRTRGRDPKGDPILTYRLKQEELPI